MSQFKLNWSETTVNDAKPGYSYKLLDKISGKYHGIDFSGIVCNSRQYTMNKDQTEIMVSLKTPITVYGTVREIITLSILDTGEVK